MALGIAGPDATTDHIDALLTAAIRAGETREAALREAAQEEDRIDRLLTERIARDAADADDERIDRDLTERIDDANELLTTPDIDTDGDEWLS